MYIVCTPLSCVWGVPLEAVVAADASCDESAAGAWWERVWWELDGIAEMEPKGSWFMIRAHKGHIGYVLGHLIAYMMDPLQGM